MPYFTHNTVRVCIIGAGLAGLSTAASLINQSKKHSKNLEIHLVEKRSLNFKRRQKIIIHRRAEALWDSWISFTKQLFDPDNKFAIDKDGNLINKDAAEIIDQPNKQQKFIRKLLRQENPAKHPNFSIRSLQEALKEYIDQNSQSNVSFKWHSKTVIDSIDLEKQECIIKDEKPIKFNYLVIADGEKRETIKQINQELEKQLIEPFRYKKIGNISYHMAVKLTVKERDNYKEYLEKTPLLEKAKRPTHNYWVVEKLKNLDWHDSKNIPYYLNDNNFYKKSFNIEKWRPHLFFASQIPKKLYSTEKNERNSLISFSKILVGYDLFLPEDDFVLDFKKSTPDQLDLTTFKVDGMMVDNPLRFLPNGGAIVVIGGSAITSYYRNGIYSTFFMNEAVKLSEGVVNGSGETQFIEFMKSFDVHKDFTLEEYGVRNEEIESILQILLKKIEDVENKILTTPEENQDLNYSRKFIELVIEILELDTNQKETEKTLKNAIKKAKYELINEVISFDKAQEISKILEEDEIIQGVRSVSVPRTPLFSK